MNNAVFKSIFLSSSLRALIVILSLFFSVGGFTETAIHNPTKATPTVKELLQRSDPVDIEQPVKFPPKGPYDPYNRGTPRSTVEGLGAALDQGDLEAAMKFMDMRQVPKHIADKGSELARQLRIIADRTFWVGPEHLSTDPEGHKDDGLASYRDRVATITTPDGPVDILLQRVPGDTKGVSIWKVANRTIADIPKLYELYGYGELADRLSRMIPEIDGAIVQPWQMVILIGIVVVAFVIAWVVTTIINLFLRRRKTPRSERLQRFIAGPVRFLAMVIIFRSNFYLIAPSIALRALFEAKTLYTLAFAWILVGGVNLLTGRLADRMRRTGNVNVMQLLKPATRAVKGVILLIAVMVWLDNMGFKISTLLAGLGVGSIAVALAAQKSIENLIGAITLYAAQPVRIGDFCRFGDTLGTVEEIGLRASKIRTLSQTLVNVPNAAFSNMEIENLTEREKILYRHKIRLRTETAPDQIRVILERIRELLSQHSRVDSEPARVRFIEFGQHSLDLEVFAYIKTQDYNDYLGISEEINLAIMDVISEAGSRIAVPTQSVYIEKRQGFGIEDRPNTA